MKALRQRVSRRLKASLWQRVFSRLPLFELTTRTQFGRMTYFSWDRFIGQGLFLDGTYDPEKVDQSLSLIKRHGADNKGVLLDIGANIGTICIPLVVDGTFDSAIAFEPDPRNFRLLQKNIAQNGLQSKITAMPYALSEAPGEMQLQLSDRNFGDHRLGNVDHEAGTEAVTVQVDTLDNLLLKLSIPAKDIGLLWMDVQGHEQYVLAGANSVLDEKCPMVVEFWPHGLKAAGTDLVQYCQLLTKHFGRFYDLGSPAPTPRPPEELDDIVKTYAGLDRFTDLLLLR